MKGKTEPDPLTMPRNLVENPSFEIDNSGSPLKWQTSNWGTNSSTFDYATSGNSGSRSGKVTVSSYTDGDAKWYPDPVVVIPDATYTFKSAYKATVGTELLVRFTVGVETYQYDYISYIPASANWNTLTFDFTAPSNATHATIFHIINSVGEVWIDDYSISKKISTDSQNLVLNPSVETVSGSLPLNWATNSWGTNNATFDYETSGYDGSRSMKVTVSSYTDGDAKWYHDEVAVTAGNSYIFRDYYKSTTATEVVLQYKTSSQTYQYASLGSVPASATWTPVYFDFTVPANITHVTAYHLINSVGELWTDSVTIMEPVPDENRIQNPSVETEVSGNPQYWSTNAWGSNTPTFTYATEGQDGSRSLKVSIANYTDGDAKWMHEPVAVTEGNVYDFSNYYKSTVSTSLVARYTVSVETYSYVWLTDLPASANWTMVNQEITAPANATEVTMFHVLATNGDLWTDNFSLTEVPAELPELGRKTETIYDATGRVVASRFNDENWNCTTYDSRGRVQSKVIADNNGKTGKTVTNNFAYGNNPQKHLVTDGSTTVISEYDFVGNLIKYTDAYGMETTYTYDNLNRLIKKESDVGKEEWNYNDYSQVTSKEYEDTVYASVTYDAYGRVATISYPEAGQLAYLGTTRDDLQRPIKYSWRQSDGTLIDEELTKSQSGLTLSQKFTQGMTEYNQEYTFDKADRLIAADYGDRQYAYSYDTATNCAFRDSNRNFNRTSDSVTVSGTTVTNNYCYDNADKLVSSTQFGTPVYDSHGNTTRLGNTSFGYDISDQNISVSEPGKSIEYTRDLLGRIIESDYNTGSEVRKYNFNGGSSSADILRDGSNNILEKYIELPGLRLTIKTSSVEYSIMSSTGNVLANATGTLKRYDPFGTQIGATDKFGFGGSQLREVDDRFSVDFIQMGARVYISVLGRFLQVDPVEGGTQNDYVYPVDPVNGNDFKGEFLENLWNGVQEAVKSVANFVVENREAIATAAGIVVGAIAVAACGVTVVCAVIAGAVVAAGTYIAANAGTDRFSLGGLLTETVIGGATGFVGGKLSGTLLKKAGEKIASVTGKSSLEILKKSTLVARVDLIPVRNANSLGHFSKAVGKVIGFPHKHVLQVNINSAGEVFKTLSKDPVPANWFDLARGLFK